MSYHLGWTMFKLKIYIYIYIESKILVYVARHRVHIFISYMPSTEWCL